MQHASSTRAVHAPPEKIWALISDVTTIDRYHPSVERADLLSAQPTGLGATRRCNFYDGTNVREEVVDLDGGKRIRLALSEFSVPMKQLEAELRLVPGAGDTTDVTFEISYVMKWGILGQIMGATAVRRQLTQMTAKVLAGLDHHVSTGERVGKDFVPKPA